MNLSNDEQVAAILARGVARVRAMEAAGETDPDVTTHRDTTDVDAAAEEQHDNPPTEAKR